MTANENLNNSANGKYNKNLQFFNLILFNS
jgi:hypothetical protein